MLKRKLQLGCALVALINIHSVKTGLMDNGISAKAETCSTADDCDAELMDARDHLAALEEREAYAQKTMVELTESITEGVDAIKVAEASIEELETDISVLQKSINDNLTKLYDLDIEVDALKDIIAGRMRITQRMNNNNIVLDALSESESLLDFVRRVRVLNHFSQQDAALMSELGDLIDQQQAMLRVLRGEQADLEQRQITLKEEIKLLNEHQETLEEKKEALANEIKYLEGDILTAEEAVSIAEAQRRILDQVHITPSTIASGDVGFIIPMPSGVVTCEWMCYTNHTGIDLSSTNRQSPILAAAAGVVVTSGWHNAFGNWVVITHDFNGSIYSTVYAHLHTTPWVSVGDTVAQGQQIGIMGSTGNSTGPHLHFEIHPGGFRWGGAVNPRHYINFPTQGRWW